MKICPNCNHRCAELAVQCANCKALLFDPQDKSSFLESRINSTIVTSPINRHTPLFMELKNSEEIEEDEQQSFEDLEQNLEQNQQNITQNNEQDYDDAIIVSSLEGSDDSSTEIDQSTDASSNLFDFKTINWDDELSNNFIQTKLSLEPENQSQSELNQTYDDSFSTQSESIPEPISQKEQSIIDKKDSIFKNLKENLSKSDNVTSKSDNGIQTSNISQKQSFQTHYNPVPPPTDMIQQKPTKTIVDEEDVIEYIVNEDLYNQFCDKIDDNTENVQPLTEEEELQRQQEFFRQYKQLNPGMKKYKTLNLKLWHYILIGVGIFAIVAIMLFIIIF